MRLRSLTLTAACLAACAALAIAQKGPSHRFVGRLACTDATGTLSANVYGYTLDVQQQSLNIGSQSSGSGAGKVTFSETEMDLDPAAFTPLLNALTSGAHFADCQLTGPGGLNVDFKLVVYDDVKLVAGTAESVAEARRANPIAQLNFSYGAMQVAYHQSTGSAGSLVGGWNRVTNTSTGGGGL